MTTNEILWKIYQEQDCSQTDFAKKVKMKRTDNISRWLSNDKILSFEKLKSITDELGYKLNLSYE